MRGRPRNEEESVVINFKLRLNPKYEGDLIAFFRGCSPRMRAKIVKASLRGGFAVQDESDLADEEILEAFEERIF